jgi:nitric oxide dioxygenase
VGLTPMVSMLETIAEINPKRELWYVHGALNGAVHAMRDHVRGLAARAPGVRTRTFYAEPRAEDQQGKHFDETGLITAGCGAQYASEDRNILSMRAEAPPARTGARAAG